MAGLNIQGLAHIGLYVNDAAETVKFYVEKLDFQLIHETVNQCPEGDVLVKFIQNGNCVLEIVQFPYKITRTDGWFDHISISVKDLDGTIKELESRGIEFTEGSYTVAPHVFPPNGTKWVFFRGPNGENIELNERM